MPIFGKKPSPPARAAANPYRADVFDKLALSFLKVAGDNYENRKLARNIFGTSGLGPAAPTGNFEQDVYNGGLATQLMLPQLYRAGQKIGSGHPVAGLADVALAVVPIPAAGKAAGKGLKKAAREWPHPMGHNRPPTTKKGLNADPRYLPPGREPIVMQAGRLRLPIGGREQMNAQHPNPFSPYHNVKPNIDPHEATATYDDFVNMPPVRMFSPHELENAAVISLYGDKTRAGQRLLSVNGVEIDPVEAHGGPGFGWMHAALGSPAVWASEPSAVASLRRQIRQHIDDGRDVYGVTTTMGPTSLDQTTMMTDTLTRLIGKSDIKPAEIEALDAFLKEWADEKGRKPFANLPSLHEPQAVEEALRGMKQGPRKNFVQLLDQAPRLAAGFPDVGASRIALTAPDLLDMPAGATGYRVVKFGPETLDRMDNVKLPHGSYSEQMAGTIVGQLDTPLPYNMVFDDLFSGRRAAGERPGSDLRSLETKKPTQIMTPEIIDRIMSYRLGVQGRR